MKRKGSPDVRTAVVWALKHRNGKGLLFAGGCYLAPWIFGTREGARKAARKFREDRLYATPVRVSLSVAVCEVEDR